MYNLFKNQELKNVFMFYILYYGIETWTSTESHTKRFKAYEMIFY